MLGRIFGSGSTPAAQMQQPTTRTTLVSNASSYTAVGEDSVKREGGDAMPRTGGLTPNLAPSATFDNFAPAAAATAATPDISAVAENAVLSLEEAEGQIERLKRHPGMLGATQVMEKHGNELNKVRDIVQKVGIQQDYQTPPVLLALVTLNGHLEALVACTAGAACTLDQLAKAMNGVQHATENLKSRLPGDIYVSNDNNASGGFQFNAIVGARPGERRMAVTTERNKSESAIQVNAPFMGDPAVFVELAKLLNPIRLRDRKRGVWPNMGGNTGFDAESDPVEGEMKKPY